MAKKISEVRALFPNLTEWHTGGGCMGLRHPHDDGGYLLITDIGGGDLPDDRDDTKDGETVELADACFGAVTVEVKNLAEWLDDQLGGGS